MSTPNHTTLTSSRPYFPTRPQLPAERPHTVHSSSRPLFANTDAIVAVPQTHPLRSASYAPGLPIEPRVDTSDAASVIDLTTFLSESDPTESRVQKRLRRYNLRLAPTFGASDTTAFPTVLAAPEEQIQTASLTRRFSKKYKQRMADLRENFSLSPMAPIGMTFGGRLRRMSTPTEQASSAASAAAAAAATIPPTSPSKRNGKHADDRPRKLRSAFLPIAGDRNDTPAPLFGTLPPTTKMPYPSRTIFNGGDGARQAAARFNACGGAEANEAAFSREDLQARRARVASLSSAADSGADLSLAHDPHDSPRFDEDGDCSMHDGDSDIFPDVTPKTFDPLLYLPDEICLQIFEQLSAPALASAVRVNRKWNGMANQTSVWRCAFTRRWARTIYTNPAPILVGGAGVGIPNQPVQPWKNMYRARKELDANWRKGADQAGKATYLSGHTDSVYCVQFDEEKIITGSRDRTIRVWDINTMQCIRVIGGPLARPTPGPKPLRTVDYPSFHSAVASVNGSVYGNSIYKVPSQWHDASILCLQYDEHILVTGSSDSDLIVWDVKTYEPIRRLKKHTGGVLDVALDAKHIVSCSKDSRIVVWNRDTYEVKDVLSGHRGPVNAVQLRGKYLVSASGDGIARLWDIEQMKLLKEFSAKERGLAAVEFSEDMKHVLAGGNDHITYKFEVETGREVAQFVGHTQLVRSLWLDSANNRVVSGSYDLDLRVYDFLTGEQLWHADEWTTSWMLAAKSDYRRIVATSQDGRILIIDFGLYKGGKNDGHPIKDVEKLRAIPLEKTSAIVFRNPFAAPGEPSMIFTR